uniref:Chromosome (Plasmid) partitioning protein ParB n=1 Tax=Vibrio splendidus TaxID=29497 RepID=A0A0H3ZMG3_VIBSP|nr:Chromosome (plasmid) partitioning protein ParB [Vibrio splendidus]
MLRPQDKRTGFNQGNQLGKRVKAEPPKKHSRLLAEKQPLQKEWWLNQMNLKLKLQFTL